MSSPPRSSLCDPCAALFKEQQSVRDIDSAFRKPSTQHRDVRSLEASAENGCSLCLTLLRGFPQQELAWAHKYLDRAFNEGIVEECRGAYGFELSQEAQGHDLHFYYRYLPPTYEVGDYDLFDLL